MGIILESHIYECNDFLMIMEQPVCSIMANSDLAQIARQVFQILLQNRFIFKDLNKKPQMRAYWLHTFAGIRRLIFVWRICREFCYAISLQNVNFDTFANEASYAHGRRHWCKKLHLNQVRNFNKFMSWCLHENMHLQPLFAAIVFTY